MTAQHVHIYDMVIIGGGLGGLRAAVEAARKGSKLAVISKVHPLRSHSVAAQGGINAALGNAEGAGDDSWYDHAFDTIKGSDYLADQDAVEIMCRAAPEAVIELEHMGVVFSRTDDGRIAQRPFGGAGFPRTCYATDRTGHNLLHTIFEHVNEADIDIFDDHFCLSLIVESNRCCGCTVLDIRDGSVHGFAAKATLLATGGFGRVFLHSTNAMINTGDGAALAYRVGAPLKDMEFVQFHPTTLYGTNILITEGARGEGGYLFNRDHERFMKNYAPKAMELAPRDIVARAIQSEIDANRGFENGYVHLDLTHLGAARIAERLPGIRQIAMDFAGIDPIDGPIPIQSGQHYSMGGIATDVFGATTVCGLFAVGECACISVHGANRLGGNSLLEAVVFGKLAGGNMAAFAAAAKPVDTKAVERAARADEARITDLLSREQGIRQSILRTGLQHTMFHHFGIFRERKSMEDGLSKLKVLQDRFKSVYIENKGKSFNQALVGVLELGNMLEIAEAVCIGAIARNESRGAHYRTDHPARDDQQFLKHTLVQSRNGKMVLAYSNVTLGLFPVREREY